MIRTFVDMDPATKTCGKVVICVGAFMGCLLLMIYSSIQTERAWYEQAMTPLGPRHEAASPADITSVCVEGVQYLRAGNSLSVKYTTHGTPAVCSQAPEPLFFR
jgi:hypothetical protein